MAKAATKTRTRVDEDTAAASAASSGSGLNADAARKARAETPVTGRWATIRIFDEEDGGEAREEIINISLMNPPGMPPDGSGLEDEDRNGVYTNEAGEKYRFEEIPATPIMGMRRGGQFQPAGDWGWRDAEDFAAHGSPAGPGVTRIGDMR
jgi:hypothetical protein